jgi:aryl-alcohol dehydrogenase-like predicted oxidoreductase
MRYKQLGQTALTVSEVWLGSVQFGWTADEPTSWAILDAFVEAGGTAIDTADVYVNWVEGMRGGIAEEIIGRWMRERQNRHQIVLATKGRGRMWPGADGEGLSRAHLLRAVDDSLRRLQTDYIDLYQSHWDDEATPLEETFETFDELVKAGKLRAIGCSNFSAERLRRSLEVSERLNLVRYESLQPHYNLAHRSEFETDLREVCQHNGLGVTPYSPLGGGFLTGKYRRGASVPESARAGSIQQRYLNERGWRLIDTLDGIAQEQGWTISQVALAWLMAQPTVTAPIIGANRLEHLQDNLGALAVTLDAGHLAALDEVSREDNPR